MSRICNSCGGIIGRDCFNPEECAWITQQMNIQNQSDHNEVEILKQENAELRNRINDLERFIEQKDPIDRAIDWCNDQIKDYYHPNQPIANEKFAAPYQKMKTYLESLKK